MLQALDVDQHVTGEGYRFVYLCMCTQIHIRAQTDAAAGGAAAADRAIGVHGASQRTK